MSFKKAALTAPVRPGSSFLRNPWVSQTMRRNPNDDNRFGEHMQWCPYIAGFSGSTGWVQKPNPGTLTLLRPSSSNAMNARASLRALSPVNRKNESDQRLISTPPWISRFCLGEWWSWKRKYVICLTKRWQNHNLWWEYWLTFIYLYTNILGAGEEKQKHDCYIPWMNSWLLHFKGTFSIILDIQTPGIRRYLNP